MKRYYEEEDITYMFDEEKRLLYISPSGEDLRQLDQCDDYCIVNVDLYEPYHENDIIQEFINKVI